MVGVCADAVFVVAAEEGAVDVVVVNKGLRQIFLSARDSAFKTLEKLRIQNENNCESMFIRSEIVSALQFGYIIHNFLYEINSESK